MNERREQILRALKSTRKRPALGAPDLGRELRQTGNTRWGSNRWAKHYAKHITR